MTNRTKRELEEENDELREVLDDVYGRLGEALGYDESDVEEDDDEEMEDDEE